MKFIKLFETQSKLYQVKVSKDAWVDVHLLAASLDEIAKEISEPVKDGIVFGAIPTLNKMVRLYHGLGDEVHIDYDVKSEKYDTLVIEYRVENPKDDREISGEIRIMPDVIHSESVSLQRSVKSIDDLAKDQAIIYAASDSFKVGHVAETWANTVRLDTNEKISVKDVLTTDMSIWKSVRNEQITEGKLPTWSRSGLMAEMHKILLSMLVLPANIKPQVIKDLKTGAIHPVDNDRYIGTAIDSMLKAVQDGIKGDDAETVQVTVLHALMHAMGEMFMATAQRYNLDWEEQKNKDAYDARSWEDAGEHGVYLYRAAINDIFNAAGVVDEYKKLIELSRQRTSAPVKKPADAWTKDPLSKRITAKKVGGDDAMSWAVLVDGKPWVTGLSQREVPSFKKSIYFQLKKKQDKLAEGVVAEAKKDEELHIGDDVIISGERTGSSRGMTGVVDSFLKDKEFVVVDLYNGGKKTFKLADVSLNDYANSDAEAQARGADDDERDGGDHRPSQREFYVVIYDEDENHTWVGKLENSDGKWHESVVAGEADIRWGGTYMGYLKPHDVMAWIHKDYNRSFEVEGPFFDKDEALDRAKTHFGGLRESAATTTPYDKILKKHGFKQTGYSRSGDSADWAHPNGDSVRVYVKGGWSCGESKGESADTLTPWLKMKGYEPITESKTVDDWKKDIASKYPQEFAKMKFKGRVQDGKNIISAEIPGQDRCYGVYDVDKEDGEVLEEAAPAPASEGYHTTGDAEDFGDCYGILVMKDGVDSNDYHGINVLFYPNGEITSSTADTTADKQWADDSDKIIAAAKKLLPTDYVKS